jgi:hypothetical protein
LVALLLPSAGAAQISDWQPDRGAYASAAYYCEGVIDSPRAGSTLASGAPIHVAGWIVDTDARGWAGFDALHVYDGLAESGRFLARGTVGLNRPDVAAALGDPDHAASGFMATIPAGVLTNGEHTLTVYAHTPDKGWWYQQLTVTLSQQPAATAGRPVVAISQPDYGDKVYAGEDTFTLMGYALDPSATLQQGSQGSGIDRVQVFINDTYFGDAELGYSDADAGALGTQFANAGFRFAFEPTMLHEGNAQLEVRAHSVVSGNDIFASTTFLIVEGQRRS